jgi:hypothetical protein
MKKWHNRMKWVKMEKEKIKERKLEKEKKEK